MKNSYFDLCKIKGFVIVYPMQIEKLTYPPSYSMQVQMIVR